MHLLLQFTSICGSSSKILLLELFLSYFGLRYRFQVISLLPLLSHLNILLILLLAHPHLSCAHFPQLPLVVVDSFELLFGEFSEILLGRFEEVVGELNLGYSSDVVIVVDLGLEVEKQRQEQLLFRVDHLLVETKTLNFGEIDICVFWRYVVCRETDHRLLRTVIQLVKDDCGLGCGDIDLLLNRLELPVYARLGNAFKNNLELFEIRDYPI